VGPEFLDIQLERVGVGMVEECGLLVQEFARLCGEASVFRIATGSTRGSQAFQSSPTART
jgi:hypothetical protein